MPNRLRPTAPLGSVTTDVTQLPGIQLPPIKDLYDLLSFRADEGRIWLQDKRMILMHAEAFGALRQELIEAVGIETARGILTRIGYIAGSKDAEIAWKVRSASDSLANVWMAGSQLHSLEGMVLVEPLRSEVVSSTGHCYLEFFWKNCVEAEAHINSYGLGAETSCWVEVGYASGFLSACMGKRIVVREVECRAHGYEQCRGIAKPVSDWSDAEDDLKYFDAHKRDSVAPRRAVEPGLALRAGASHRPIGASGSFNAVVHKVQRVAPTNASVLFLGESGVGKSHFAREVHQLSNRREQAFVEVNCAAIPDSLIESELFGVERGAYSGAVESRPGRFEVADRGTIFLDEIATLSLTAQGKLLRVLQTGQMERLGSAKTLRVDVRVVTATNENLPAAVKEGRFREDLFYRLNVFPISIPPLRERKDDLPILLEHCIEKFTAVHGRRITGVTPRALMAVLAHNWPGNIRELENVIERGIILADDDTSLDIRHLFSVDGSFQAKDLMGLSTLGGLIEKSMDDDRDGAGPQAVDDLEAWASSYVRSESADLCAVEQALVRAAIEACDGNISKAAGRLRLSRHQLDYRAKKMAG